MQYICAHVYRMIKPYNAIFKKKYLGKKANSALMLFLHLLKSEMKNRKKWDSPML